ncbi:DUF4342 domain-containing protein [Albidovulum sp.]
MTAKKPSDGPTGGTEPPRKRSLSEEIEVAGDQLVARVKELAADAKVKRIRITEPDGDLVLEVPLAIGAIAGGAVVLAAPLLAVIGALAAFVTKVKIEVIRDEESGSGN